MRSIRLFVGQVMTSLWPLRCVACPTEVPESTAFCPDCQSTLLRRNKVERLSFPEPPAWNAARAAYAYGGQLATAIHQAKYRLSGANARRLGRLLIPHCPPADFVVPVPLHPRRLRARGFNQAAELCRGAGKSPNLDLLVRVRDTPSQTDLPPRARLANMTAAFKVTDPDAICDRTILLVDDVMTTGATAHACSAALCQAGARRVMFLALARTP